MIVLWHAGLHLWLLSKLSSIARGFLIDSMSMEGGGVVGGGGATNIVIHHGSTSQPKYTMVGVSCWWWAIMVGGKCLVRSILAGRTCVWLKWRLL